MALTVLQIIQTACKRIGILSPNAAVTATDQQIIQLVALAEEEGQELATRYNWQALQTEASFTTVATQLQTTLASVTTCFDYIVNNTIWNRTQRRPVYGPQTQQDWQARQAMNFTGPFSAYRIKGDAIYFDPAPAAGESCYFEYMSRAWVAKAAGGVSSTWTADGDTPRFGDQLMVLGIIWRWKAAKGLDYSEDFTKYERRVMDAMTRDGGKPVLSMNGGCDEIAPVVLVPAGSWPV